MANISIVQTVFGNGSNGASSVAKSVTVTAGNALWVVATGGSAQSVSSVTDNSGGGPNTYNALTVGTHTGQTHKLFPFASGNIKGGTYTITVNFSGATDNPSIMVMELNNAALTQADGSNANYQGSPSSTSTDGIVSGSATNTNQPALVVGMQYNGGTVSSGTGFTFDTFNTTFGGQGSGYGVTVGTQYKRITATGSQQSTWTNSNSSDSILSIMAIFDELVAAAAAAEVQLERSPGRGLNRGHR